MTESHKKKILGILGGMGPLASAEFMKTIYEYGLSGKYEQESPKVVLYSDPTFPDRTKVLLKGNYNRLLKKLIDALYHLYELDVSSIVICCITSHYLLPKLPTKLRKRIISLVDVILKKTIERRAKQLLLCTNGTRKLKIFQSHKLWSLAKDYIVLPNERDQNMIHNMAYQIKKGDNSTKLMPKLKSFLSKYNVHSFIAGCTEFHLITKQLASLESNQTDIIYLDPLTIIAKKLR